MAADAQAQLRLLVLVLLLAWPCCCLSFVGSLACGPADLHPVVLLPGYACGQLDARLTHEFDPSTAPSCGGARMPVVGSGWFRLWENYTALQEDPALAPCYAELLRLVYDPVAGDYRNVPGVETRVVSFGSTSGFGSSDDPATTNTCMQKLVEALEGVGYIEGETLFGAPYDSRYAAAPPGQASTEFNRFLSQLTALVEHASERNGDTPVILVTHSFGGINADVFLRRSPAAWRARYIRHFVMVSTGAGGGVFPLQFGGGSISSGPLWFPETRRSLATALSVLPSPAVFGHAPVVVTRARNYSAYDIPEYLKASGFSDDEVERYVTRVLPVTLGFGAPGVPVTCINAVGVPTVERLVYWDGDFGVNPEAVYGDGDSAINIVSVLALGTMIGAQPGQDYFKSILLRNTSHGGTISDEFALRRVVNEILEASGNSLNAI